MTDRSGLEALENAVRTFAEEREWGRFHDPKNLAMALASESGELCAVLRWTRNSESDLAARTEPTRSAILAEMGDVAVLLLLMCQRIDARLDDVVLSKLAANGLKYPIESSVGRPDAPDR